MSLQAIPESWRRTVARILRRGDRKWIRSTDDFWNRYSADFPNAWKNDVESAIANELERNATQGCLVPMNPPPAGTTWEFYSIFDNERIYTKVLLTNDQKTVWLFSAHRPLQAKLRCE